MELVSREVVVWITAAAIAVVLLNYLPAIMVKMWQRWRLNVKCRGKLVLTYDDGPDPLLTDALVSLLDRYGVKASFFLVGFRAQRSPAMCDRLLKSGHELGCHGHMHVHGWRVWPWKAVRDVNDGYQALQPWIAPNAPYRPAFGKFTTLTWLAVLIRGAPLRWWTCDGRDTAPELPDAARLAHDIAEKRGAVVLLHSHDRGTERQRYVLQLTEEILIAARQRSLKICTLSELYSTMKVHDDRDHR